MLICTAPKKKATKKQYFDFGTKLAEQVPYLIATCESDRRNLLVSRINV